MLGFLYFNRRKTSILQIMRKIILGAAALAILSLSCNKDKGFTKATVMDTGDVTNNGCGYLLRLEDGRDEKPVYMPSNYQHDGLKVLVKFHNTGILDTCRSLPPREFYDQVQIDEIKKDTN